MVGSEEPKKVERKRNRVEKDVPREVAASGEQPRLESTAKLASLSSASPSPDRPVT